MIVVRDIFQLRFGAAREAVALLQEGMSFMRETLQEPRALTDLTGPYYTLVLEASWDSLATYESTMATNLKDPKWRDWYQKFVPLVESGRREIFSVVPMNAPTPGTTKARERVEVHARA